MSSEYFNLDELFCSVLTDSSFSPLTVVESGSLAGVTTRKTEDCEITTELALLITFLLGALAREGLASKAVAVEMTALLGS